MTHLIIDGLLDANTAADFLAFAIARESDFVASAVGAQADVVDLIRKSRRLNDLGRFAPILEQALLAKASDLIASLGLTPFKPTGVELELVAHGDGGYYKRHIDLFTGPEERSGRGDDRMVSVVYYLHKEPKPFSGGELRLYPHPDPSKAEISVDIAPAHGKAVAFSTWLAHEVLPVQCSSGHFSDSRFAINCWILRSR